MTPRASTPSSPPGREAPSPSRLARWERRVVETLEIWAHETAKGIERTARVVVGPDEPFEGLTQAEMEASHWDALARVLQRQGIGVEAAELRALRHDVELSDRMLARVAVPRHDIR